MNKIIFLFYSLVLGAGMSWAGPLEDAKKAFSAKNYEKVVTLLEPESEGGGAEIEIDLLLGHAYAKLERWPEAIKAFEAAVQKEPESLAGHLQLGFLYEKTKQPEKAKAAWQKVLGLAKNEKTKKLAQKHLDNLK